MISGLCIFLPAEAQRHMLCVARKSRFSHFSQRPKFSKGALRAVCTMTCADASGGTYHVRRRRLHSNIAAEHMQRCAGICVCCKCSSSAASLPALQLEQHRLAQERGREQESRESRHRMEAALVAEGFHSEELLSSPPIFLKENGHYRPSPPQKNRLRRSQKASFPRGRRCAARIGYPGLDYHPCQLRGAVTIPGTIT